MRRLALSLGVVLALAAATVGGFSLYYADRLDDMKLPGLSAIVAIAANVMFMVADRARGRPHPRH